MIIYSQGNEEKVERDFLVELAGSFILNSTLGPIEIVEYLEKGLHRTLTDEEIAILAEAWNSWTSCRRWNELFTK